MALRAIKRVRDQINRAPLFQLIKMSAMLINCLLLFEPVKLEIYVYILLLKTEILGKISLVPSRPRVPFNSWECTFLGGAKMELVDLQRAR